MAFARSDSLFGKKKEDGEESDEENKDENGINPSSYSESATEGLKYSSLPPEKSPYVRIFSVTSRNLNTNRNMSRSSRSLPQRG